MTLGRDGYREIFQAGEALDHIAVIDRQHPHELLIQAAAVWRVPLAHDVAVTVAGAPVGEPSLGPVAFMHRASAAENPTAPLAHHMLDSTHIAMGVLLRVVDPDARSWRHRQHNRVRTSRERISTACLPRPPTRSAHTRCTDGSRPCRSRRICCASAVHGFFARKTAHVPEGTGGIDVVTALTLGGVRTTGRWAGWDVGAGADVTFYAVPGVLDPSHGDRPVSFHLFLRVRPPAPMGRMTDTIMTRVMR